MQMVNVRFPKKGAYGFEMVDAPRVISADSPSMEYLRRIE
jgi:hypothetical protein